MRGYFRLVYRLVGLVFIQFIMGLVGLVTVIVLAPFQNARYTMLARIMQVWGKLCCWVMNIRILQAGSAGQPDHGALIVSNHVGSVDIFVMAACFKMSFVSKSDIRTWPLIGYLTRIANTIYIDRTRRRELAGMVQAISDRLRSGYSVVVFPEGGATSGHQVERFKSSAFEAVVQAESSVLPVMIRYYDDGEPSVACWPLGITFMANIIRLLMHPRLNVKVWILPEVTGETDRQVFAEKSRALISDKFQETGGSPVAKS
ncbi:MAG: 1-acyl-sn-glycerol-3-phosphate acyltransferase [Nitrospinota bacterium]|nr:1-acyl-sn-glycerol-3-phosphate acyltransferase [Nitrospinota bacterium]